MLKPIDGEGKAVGAILSEGPKFIVPYFQRGYAWQREHVERLYRDLTAYSAGGQGIDWFPLGAIIVSPTDDGAALAIADGQQRLVTLTILIAILRDLETDEALRDRLAACIADADGTPRLVARDSVQAALRQFVFALHSTQAEAAGEEDGLDDEAGSGDDVIVENRDWLRQELAELVPEARQQLARFVLDRIFLVVITVSGEAAARLLFSTMHETGVKPQAADLLKSQVLGRLVGPSRERGQTVWEGLEARLGRDRMDSLLLHVASIKAKKIAIGRGDVAIASTFDLATAEGAGDFVFNHLRPMGVRHADILGAGASPFATPGDVFRRLQYLGWIVRHETWRLPLLLWLKEKKYDDPQTLMFLSRLEALAWVHWIKAEEVRRRDRRYLTILTEVEQGRALDPGAALTIREDEREAVRGLLTETNLFRRPYRLFLLLRLNAICEGEERVTLPPEATVEHVCPQRPSADSRWMRDFGASDSIAMRRHQLGNLTLLTTEEQIAAGNKEFDEKQLVYAKSRFALTRLLAREAGWTEETVRARTASLVDSLMMSFGLAGD